MIKVVAAFISGSKGHFLVARRAKGELADLWEFPGGKVEEGEANARRTGAEKSKRSGGSRGTKKTQSGKAKRGSDPGAAKEK